MNRRRRLLNITLLIICIILGVTAVWITRQPSPLVSPSLTTVSVNQAVTGDTVPRSVDTSVIAPVLPPDTIVSLPEPIVEPANRISPPIHSGKSTTTTFKESDLEHMIANHPFAREARKVLEGNLEETDSMSRRSILNYCEHLRTAYTTRDIDFIRQVFSNDALIIVGHSVKSHKNNSNTLGTGTKVQYSIRTKEAYLKKLAEVFAANKNINMTFSDFNIIRHPSISGIYGVTLRQRYTSDRYSDEGYLFLLWDFRNPSMPQIHVRTWQAADNLTDTDDLIDLSDFNLQ